MTLETHSRFAFIPANKIERGLKYWEIQFDHVPICISNCARPGDEPSTAHYFNSFNSGSIEYNNAIALAQIYINGQQWIYFESYAESSQGRKPFRGFVQATYVTER